MTVTWRQRRGRKWPHAAWAVACSICGAEPGRGCTALYARGKEIAPHLVRVMVAEALGFVTVPDEQAKQGEMFDERRAKG